MAVQPARSFLPDTNLIVAAFLDDPRTAAFWAAIFDGRLPVAVSDHLLAEARVVLMRPPLRAIRGWSAEQVHDRLAGLFRRARHLPAPDVHAARLGASRRPAPDPGDQFLWDLLNMHPDLVLVTRDKRLLKHKPMKPRVWTVERVMAEPGLTSAAAAGGILDAMRGHLPTDTPDPSDDARLQAHA
jgi:uncharacterized protein